VRRSALPYAPSFSTHIAVGSTRSALSVVTVGIRVGDDDEVRRVAVAGQAFLHQVGARLHVVVDLHPVAVELAVLQHPVLQHRVVSGLVGDRPLGQLPDALGLGAVLGVGHEHVGRQPVRERADLARGAARRRLAGERERAVAGRRDLAAAEGGCCRRGCCTTRRACAG
jgi:hypothetical protein